MPLDDNPTQQTEKNLIDIGDEAEDEKEVKGDALQFVPPPLQKVIDEPVNFTRRKENDNEYKAPPLNAFSFINSTPQPVAPSNLKKQDSEHDPFSGAGKKKEAKEVQTDDQEE